MSRNRKRIRAKDRTMMASRRYQPTWECLRGRVSDALWPRARSFGRTLRPRLGYATTVCVFTGKTRGRKCVLQAIANSPNRLQQGGSAAPGFNLVAYAPDAGIDRPRSHEAFLTPNCIEQLIASKDTALIARHIFQQAKFEHGCRNHRPRNRDPHSEEIQFQVAQLQFRILRDLRRDPRKRGAS